MPANDEARLDELYQEVLHIEMDMTLEEETWRMYSQEHRRKLRRWLRRADEEIKALRESQRDHLLECASDILQWVKDFSENPKGKRILSTLGSLVLCRGPYFKCRLRDEEKFQARLTCDRNGLLRYQEYYDDVLRPRSTKVLTNPAQVVNYLHPNFVVSAFDAISEGKVWEEIERAIRWRAQIFDIRRERGWSREGLIPQQRTAR